jgi:hypothetical protein
MKIYIRRSGGVAGLTLEGEVDTRDLSSELSQKAEAMMAAENLRAICAAGRPKAPDTYQYEIRVSDKDAFEAFTLDESAVGDTERDVLDGLMHAIRRKARGGGGKRGKTGR